MERGAPRVAEDATQARGAFLPGGEAVALFVLHADRWPICVAADRMIPVPPTCSLIASGSSAPSGTRPRRHGGVAAEPSRGAWPPVLRP